MISGDQTFSARWPVVARVEAFLLLTAIFLTFHAMPTLRSYLDATAAIEISRLGIPKEPATWGLLVFLLAGPFWGVLLVGDRLLQRKHAYVWLSMVGILMWTGLAAIVSRDPALIIPMAWMRRGLSVVPPGQTAIAVASIAILVHAWPIWIGLNDHGPVEVTDEGETAWQTLRAQGRQRPHRMVSGVIVGLSGLLLLLLVGSRHYWQPSVMGVASVPTPLPAIWSPSAARTAPEPAPLPNVVTLGGAADAWRQANGSFAFNVTVNDKQMPMMFDTGASIVTLRAEDAARLGVPLDGLRFTLRSRTANGIAAMAPITLDTMTVGSITLHQVQAVVAKPGALSVNLLGQTFLERLRDYEVEGNRLLLHGR